VEKLRYWYVVDAGADFNTSHVGVREEEGSDGGYAWYCCFAVTLAAWSGSGLLRITSRRWK